MKVSCIKEKVRERINQAEKVTGKNMSLPILGALLLSAKDGKFTVRATNLDLGVEFDIPAKIETDGEVAVPGSVFGSVLSNMYDGKNVELELVNDNLVVSAGGNTALVKSLSPEEFPTLPAVAHENAFTIDAQVLVSGIKSVWYSSALSDIKPEIASVYVYFDDGNIVFVSTDSFRLAEKKIKVKEVSDFGGIILPIKNVNDIVRILDGVSGDVIVSFDENQVSFSAEGLYVTSRIVNGVYPDYGQIIPKDFSTTLTALKKDVDHALKLTNIFTDKFHKVTLSTNIERGVLELSSRNADVGENVTQVDVKADGDDISVNFNYRYIGDGLQSIDEDSITIKFSNEREVLVIRGASSESFTYLVKPMNK